MNVDLITHRHTQSAADRLQKLVGQALTKGNRTAQKKFLADAVRDDADLLREMLWKYFDPAAAALLDAAKAKLAKADKEEPATSPPGTRSPIPSRRYPPIDPSNARIAPALKFAINEIPIMEVEIPMARGWLNTNRRNGRYVELVLAGLPLVYEKISKFRRTEDMLAFWDQAENERRMNS